jgi:hypothetical protein
MPKKSSIKLPKAVVEKAEDNVEDLQVSESQELLGGQDIMKSLNDDKGIRL